MKSKAESYYERTIGNAPPFARWPFRKLVAQKREWRVRASTSYIWISALEGKMTNVEVHSGVTPRSRRRGNRRSNARRVVFYLSLPPYRNYGVREVKSRFSDHRTLLDKCEIGIRFARERELAFCLVPELAGPLNARGVHVDDRHLLISTKEPSGTAS